MKFLFTFFISCVFYFSAKAVYLTPNTGQTYSLHDLVTNSAGIVTFNGTDYFIHDSVVVSANDRLFINTNEKIRFDANTYLRAEGTLTINPPDSVVFTSSVAGGNYLGVWVMNNSSSVIKKLTMENGNSFRIFDGSILIDSCIFRNNTYTSAFGGSTINLFRSNSTISNSLFINNGRAVIEGGGNIENAPKIIENVFINNDVSNANKPQINLGNSGPDTTKVIGNLIYGGSVMSGGIGFYPFNPGMASYYLISNNTIRKNRYGITVIGGANINCRINDNIIDSNNIQGDPIAGGSGIAFNGGGLNNYQNTVVTNNTFRANLWGITILLGSRPNLGDLTNADATDDGGNIFINNSNTSTPGIDVYNNSPYTIMAQGNDWNTNNVAEIPNHIFDITDNINLGVVDYGFAVLPVELLDFSATKNNENALLSWTFAATVDLDRVEIEKSNDGRNFKPLGIVNANSLFNRYDFTDVKIDKVSTSYYRLKVIRKDGKFYYSEVRSLKPVFTNDVEIFPSLVKGNQTFKISFNSTQNKKVQLKLYSADGRLLLEKNQRSINGRNIVEVTGTRLPSGVVYVKLLLDEEILTGQFSHIR